MNFKSAEDAFKVLNKIYHVDQNLNGDEYLIALIKNIATYLDIKYVIIGMPSTNTSIIQTKIAWANGAIVDNFEYNLKGTPCEEVISGHRVCLHSQDVYSLFPTDLLLKDMMVEAYVGSPILNAKNELIGILVLLDTKKFEFPQFISSLTELLANRIGLEISRKMTEEKLSNYNNELEILVESKTKIIKETNEKMFAQEKLASLGRVVAGVAHEIRNPLNIILNCGLIAQNSIDSLSSNNIELEEIKEAIELINSNSQRLQQIVNDMLVQSASESKILKFDLKEIISESIKYSIHTLKLKNQKIQIEFNKNFPVQEILISLSSDIQSLFINLFENAIIAIESNHNTISKGLIDVTIIKNIDEIVIEITDNGIGISNDIKDKIFEPFFTTKSAQNGTGLGLHLVKSIVAKNKGEIYVESEKEKYTKFIIKFPNNNI